MSSNKIQDLASSMASYADNQEQLLTPLVVSKLSKSLAENPHDQTIGGVIRVLESMMEKNKNFIRKADLKDLYKKYYVVGTKFAEAMESDLGDISYKTQVKTMDHSSTTELDMYNGADEVLTNALNSAFDANEPLKEYSEKVAATVVKSVKSELSSWNLPAIKVSVDAGNEKFIVVRADYETPKGLTSFYVPVDISGKILQASLFVGNFGPEKLNNASIKNYITSNAGSKLQLSASSILEVLVKSASKNKEISAAEIAVMKLNASRKPQAEFFGNQILGQKFAEDGKKDVVVPESEYFSSFDVKLKTPAGTACFAFGTDKIKIASDVVSRILSSFGQKNTQIAITANNIDTVFYACSLNNGKIGFSVPVKISSGKVDMPKFLISNGSVLPLNEVTISRLTTENVSDNRSAAMASPLFDLKPSDVINGLRISMDEGNLAAAEDAMNVLANCGDEKAHATGFEIYMSGLSKKASTIEAGCCSLMKTSSSTHMICSHTGLPEHKVYQDGDGNCRPLYRRGMDETYEAASFMNAKIFGN